MFYMIRWETPDNFQFTSATREELAGKVTEILADPKAILWGIESEVLAVTRAPRYPFGYKGKRIMSMLFHSDGCIIANIRVNHYLVYFQPVCEHTKLRGAYIAIDATDADAAMEFAATWIKLAQLKPVSVVQVTAVPDMAIVHTP
jgi:hypothetical protein